MATNDVPYWLSIRHAIKKGGNQEMVDDIAWEVRGIWGLGFGALNGCIMMGCYSAKAWAGFI